MSNFDRKEMLVEPEHTPSSKDQHEFDLNSRDQRGRHYSFISELTGMEEEESTVRPCRRGTMSSKSRCKTCYQRERRNDPTAKSVEIKKRCANPTNGCIICNEYVCAACWPIHVEEVRRRRNNPNTNDQEQPIQPGEEDNVRSRSVVMDSMLATNNITWMQFLETKWEKKAHLFTYDADILPSTQGNPLSTSNSSVSSASSSISLSIVSIPTKSLVPAIYGGDGCWRKNNMEVFPLREIIRQGWHILTTLMAGNNNAATGTMPHHIGSYCNESMIKISILQNFQPKTRDEIMRLYGGDLYSSYLAGCSIVWENCDMLSPHIAVLCQDLQGKLDGEDETKRRRPFCKAHATAYLTPPQHNETFPTKTADRNVIVFQLIGRKYWKTWWPSHGESSSETGTTSNETASSFNGYLYPGHILYIPKGMSYQCRSKNPSPPNENKSDEGVTNASESDPSLSFHVTVALDKSDELMAKTTGSEATKPPPVVPEIPSSNPEVITADEEAKQQDKTEKTNNDRDIALSRKRKLVINDAKRKSPDWRLKRKYTSEGLVFTPPPPGPPAASNPFLTKVGPTAVSQISFHTFIRVSSQEEQKRGQELLANASQARSDEKWDTGIRRELRGVATVLASRFRSLMMEDRPKMPHRRVVELCEFVKNSFEDKSDLSLVCDLTLLALVKREIESGNLAVVHPG